MQLQNTVVWICCVKHIIGIRHHPKKYYSIRLSGCMRDWQHIGVDWDSGSWVAVGVTEDLEFGVEVYERLGELWNEHRSTVSRIVVDVPIGLCGTVEDPAGARIDKDGELHRACDMLARSLIGSRHSSVFNPPCREVVEEAVEPDHGYRLKDDIYSEMNAKNKALTGKGLTKQGLNIAPGILEVDDLIRDAQIDNEIMVEGHPELCFRAFGEEDLDYSKRTAPGLAERLELLRSLDEYTQGTWTDLAMAVGNVGISPGIDDLTDALALALTACAEDDEIHSLPGDYPKDGENMPVRMVYRREEPFSLSIE